MNFRIRSARTACGVVALATMLGLTACGGGGDDSSSSSSSNSTSSTQEQVATTTPPSSAPVTTQPTTPTPQPEPAVIGTVSLQWVAPQQNTDGTALQNLAGYTVVYGNSATDLDQSIRIDNPSIDRYVVEQLPSGTYYFAIKAFNSVGAESELSNVVAKVIG